jgi:hypothetical protein
MIGTKSRYNKMKWDKTQSIRDIKAKERTIPMQQQLLHGLLT